ncbi:MAG: GxxExxY protein, partial [Gammaproteobacteria bacterium]
MAKAGLERLATLVVDTGYHSHRELGPGLLESVYQAVLTSRLSQLGVRVEQEKAVGISVDGLYFANACRVDLFLDDHLVVELKAVEKISGLHIRQTLTYV